AGSWRGRRSGWSSRSCNWPSSSAASTSARRREAGLLPLLGGRREQGQHLEALFQQRAGVLRVAALAVAVVQQAVAAALGAQAGLALVELEHVRGEQLADRLLVAAA